MPVRHGLSKPTEATKMKVNYEMHTPTKTSKTLVRRRAKPSASVTKTPTSHMTYSPTETTKSLVSHKTNITAPAHLGATVLGP